MCTCVCVFQPFPLLYTALCEIYKSNTLLAANLRKTVYRLFGGGGGGDPDMFIDTVDRLYSDTQWGLTIVSDWEVVGLRSDSKHTCVLRMLTVPSKMVGLVTMLNYCNVGLQRFHCIYVRMHIDIS